MARTRDKTPEDWVEVKAVKVKSRGGEDGESRM